MKLNVVRVGNDGEGIAFSNNKPVFIYYAYKGEKVIADVSKNKRGALMGDLKKVIKRSDKRVKAPCPYYGDCGGCNLMHINYIESLKHKREVLKFLLDKNLRKETRYTNISNTHGSEDTFNYRNKINVPVRVINGNNAIGLFYRGSNKFLKIDSCMIQENNLNDVAKEILYLMDKLNINGYNPKSKKGSVVNLSIRSNLEGKMQVTFIVNKKINLNTIASELMKLNKDVVSVYKSYVKDYKTNRDMFNGLMSLVKGSKNLEMNLGDNKFFVTPSAFFQLNSKQALKLYELVVKKAKFKKNDVVLDAYSGVGTIATFISPYVKQVVAIESIKAAVNAMNESNKVNNIKNMRTITGDAIKVTNYLKLKFDVMVFDPPRGGLGDIVCKYILKQRPRKVIYVSCNPQTLVNDLKILSRKYNIISVDPFDMFPQTSHIESVTVLELN